MRRCWLILLLFTLAQCREVYTVIPPSGANGALVIEGFLNANGRSKIKVSRTTTLSDRRIAPEIGALVLIEEENGGSTFPVYERATGEYESDPQLFDANNRYRLRITTHDNRQYATDFSNYLVTPVLDSLSWARQNGGVQIFANSRNELNTTQYYKWDYEETYEFHSAFRATIYFKKVSDTDTGGVYELDYFDPATKSFNNDLFTCYNGKISSSINLVNTAALTSNVLLYPVQFVREGAIEIGVLYSLNVNQYAISASANEFFARMKKNTESLGSIFDAQPSELVGNIKCVTDPSELVIGYVETTTVESKRLFISNDELPGWGYSLDCPTYGDDPSVYPYDNNPGLFPNIIKRNLVPTVPARTMFGAIITFYVEQLDCVDCRLRGSPDKPPFWP